MLYVNNWKALEGVGMLTCPSLSLTTKSMGESWPCMARYKVFRLMPCLDVLNASVQGYPTVLGGRFLANFKGEGHKDI